jgi:hypothetical protein
MNNKIAGFLILFFVVYVITYLDYLWAVAVLEYLLSIYWILKVLISCILDF